MLDLRPSLLAKTENQRHYNACGGEGATYYVEAIHRKFDPEHAVEFSVAFSWNATKIAQAKQAADNRGVMGVTLMNTLKKIGACPESIWPSTDANMLATPPAAAYEAAKQYRIGSWISIDTPAEARKYLAKGLPVLCEAKLPDGFVGIKGPLDTHPAQWRALGIGRPQYGHFMAVFGYTDDCLLIQNSWGDAWGDHGATLIPDDKLDGQMWFKGYVITGLRWQWLRNIKKFWKDFLA